MFLIKKMIVLLLNFNTFLKIFFSGQKDRVYLMFLPQYLNWGDFAIRISEKEFLNAILGQRRIIDVSIQFYVYFKDFINKRIRDHDLLMITGGGWLGDLWPYLNESANEIIENFPNNKIVIFPQTIYIENGDSETLAEMRHIYKKHKKLYVFLRDKRSLLFFQDYIYEGHYDNLFLMPDMVTRLNCEQAIKRKKDVLMCLRDDKERVLSDGIKKEIVGFMKERGRRTYSIRMAYPNCPLIVPYFIGDYITKNKIKTFSKYKLAITDRLHGMIFAAITGTPCIAFDNISRKISGVYEFLSHLNYIRVVSNMVEFGKAYEEITSIENTYYNNQAILEQFAIFNDFIEEFYFGCKEGS